MPTWPSPRSERLGTPKVPAIRFTRGTSFEASRFAYVAACQVARPPSTDRTGFPAPEGFYFQAFGSLVARPAAGYDYNMDGLLVLAGLSPAGMAASLAAPDPDEPNSSIRLLPRVCDGELPYAAQRLGHASPALGPVRALLLRVSLGPRPWLHHLRRRLPSFVQWLHSLLWRSQTSPDRASAATAPRLPAADHPTRGAYGQPGDLPVPGQGACAHARFYDHAGPSKRSRWRA